MKNRTKLRQSRGSALLAALIVIVILTVAAAGVLSYSLTTYRNSIRQAMLDQGKEIADSEMENMYYTWKGLLLQKKAVANIESLMSALTSSTTPLAATFQTSNGWSVTRSIVWNKIPAPSVDGGATGIVPGTQQIGRNYYFTVETSASINQPLLGKVTYDSGRHFVYSSTSLFQYAVFYQGNLEMAAGGNMTIGGPVSTNASAYLGAQDNNGSPFTLTLTDKVYYFQDYNGATDPLSGETDLLQGTSSLVDPVYNPNALAAAPADQASQRALQVAKLSAQSSFIGGVDVAADIANPAYAQAYSNLQGVVDPNEVYRAVIAPPPVDDTGALLPEDQTVAGSRMYNNAGIVITIQQTANGIPNPLTGGNVVIHVGISPEATTPANAGNISMYDNVAAFASIVHPTGAATDVIQGVRQTVQDPREALNGSSGVNMTTLDIGNLNNALNSAGTMAGALQTNYNGVVYIYDLTNNSTSSVNGVVGVNSSNNLNGIRLTDATTTPAFNDQNSNPLGFSVVSNNGVYVQGDYNTTPITVAGASVNNPAAIMGDAVTALSQLWNIGDNGALTMIGGGHSGAAARDAGPSLPTAANGVNPASAGTANGMTVNAAILTGNTPTTTSTNSGGAQNLVRMVEDWYYPDPLGNGTGMALTLNGSLGQIFTSKYFTGAYAPGVQAALGAGNRVYIQPKTRNFDYDLNFKNRTPAGSPSTTAFTRGDFFFW